MAHRIIPHGKNFEPLAAFIASSSVSFPLPAFFVPGSLWAIQDLARRVRRLWECATQQFQVGGLEEWKQNQAKPSQESFSAADAWSVISLPEAKRINVWENRYFRQ